MKRKNHIFGFIFASLVLVACNDKNTSPEPPAPEKIIAIPDVAFKAFLLANDAINTNGDDQLQESEALNFAGELIVPSDKGIKSVEGIEHFIKLTGLNCHGLELGSLNLTQNTELQTLDVGQNKLKVLDVAHHTKLKRLRCSENELQNLDISQLSSLEELNCGFNSLRELDVRTNGKLKKLNAIGNPLLTCILTQNNESLKGRTADTGVYWGANCEQAPANAIVNIPDPNFKKTLLAHGVSITDKSLKEAYGIETIDTNKDGEIQVSEAKAYKGALCFDGNFAPYVREIKSFEGLEYFTSLGYLYVYGLPSAEKLNLNGNTRLRFFEVIAAASLTEVKVENCPLLYGVHITKTALKEIATDKNPQLKTLYISKNKLTNLNVTKNPFLKELQCDYNELQTIDLSANKKLTTLNISDNKISNFDITQCADLVYLNCMNNDELRTVDISGNPGLYDLVAHNKNLTCIKVTEEQLKEQHPYWFKSEKAVYRLKCE